MEPLLLNIGGKMNKGQCIGCNFWDACDLASWKKAGYDIGSCPCQKCLVKVSCSCNCSNFERYSDHRCSQMNKLKEYVERNQKYGAISQQSIISSR